MQHAEPTADCGVIIGRFQVAELHDGHRALIDNVMARHRKVAVLLGVSPLTNSINNPLDFESRKQMLCSAYPSLTVLYVKDVNDDALWSKQVDALVGDWLSPTQTALLYGSRDSFIKSYTGRFDTYELPTHHTKPGTVYREEIGREARDSEDFRRGVIWASRNRYPISYQTVDVAIFNEGYTQMLLGQKKNETGWRLIGGFADPNSPSLEDDARREVMEECGAKLLRLSYVRSAIVDDWRYQGEPDCIKTALFVATTADTDLVAGDDIERVCWFSRAELDPTSQWRIIDIHRDLVRYALMAAHPAADDFKKEN